MYKTGIIPSPKDPRDFVIVPAAIATSYEEHFRQPDPRVGKQKEQNCGAYSTALSLEAVTGVRLSKGWHYGDREPEHYQGEGRILREVCDTLLKHGTCKLADYNKEYEVYKAQQDVKAKLTTHRIKAAPQRIKAYARCQNEAAIKTALKKNYGVVFAAACESFKTVKTNGLYLFRMRTPLYGYHAMAITGWDGEYGYCPQSWGTRFGKKGFCHVPFVDILQLNDVWALEPFSVEKTIIQKTLRKGMKGAEVVELQQALLTLGYNLGKWGADGDFGTATYNAVIRFQLAGGLDVDGIAGPQTLEALYGD